MWTAHQYRQLVRASGWYDLIVTAALVTPWTFVLLHDALVALNLPGELPPFAPVHMLMANLMGSIVCVWSVLRIRDPQAIFGRYDAVGRVLFATWQIYALAHGASTVLVMVVVFEVLWAVAQLMPVHRTAR